MNDRANPFANLAEPPEFKPRPRREPAIANEAIERIAEEHNFPSRQAPPRAPKEPKRKRRVYRTGRNQQFNIKATSGTIERFQKMADDRNIPQCALLELALDALEKHGRPSAT